MFDIGLGELALIAVLALVIAGPERLPGIMRGLGRFAARARSVASALRTELEREVGSEETRQRRDVDPPSGSESANESVRDSASEETGKAKEARRDD